MTNDNSNFLASTDRKRTFFEWARGWW